MKWLVTILAILVGGLLLATLKLANVKPVETSAEALREMAELREALSCGSGQQHPLRAPQRVQRIAFEIVSSGLHVEPMPLGELVRLNHNAVAAIIAVQPGALAELDQHCQARLR
jgi:hypothetical protein